MGRPEVIIWSPSEDECRTWWISGRPNDQIRPACGLPARQVMLVYRSGQKYGGHRASSSTTHTRYDSTVLVWHHQHLCDARELGEARPVRACPTGRHHASAVALHAEAVRAVGGVGVGDDIAPSTNVVTFFSTFATNLVHAMSEIYRDICLQMQRHSRHVVTFAYLPVGR